MKNYIIIGAICLSSLSLVSCRDTLDTHPTASFVEDVVWGSVETVKDYINDAYKAILVDNSSYAGSGSTILWESRTPNSVRCDQVGYGCDLFPMELNISAASDFGPNRFKVLRQCNMIIDKVSKMEISDAEKAELMAHGYLMRGMIFFDATRKMGRIVPVCQTFTTEDEDACRIPMTDSVAESYTYVISDLEKSIKNLPATASKGLPTKWAAEMILSRACLQAYAYTNNSAYLTKAYDAAKDIVNNSGVVLSSSEHLYDGTDPYNDEILWGYYYKAQDTGMNALDELLHTFGLSRDSDQAASYSEHIHVMKNGLTYGGWGIYFPTQDMVDQYLVIDDNTGKALPWYETSQYLNNVDIQDPSTITEAGQIYQYNKTNGDIRRMPTPQDLIQWNEAYPGFLRYVTLKDGASRNLSQLMYSNRDKRFYTNIVYDGCTWLGEYIDTNWGGNMFQGIRDKEDGGWYTTVTGYFWRKNNQSGTLPRAHVSVQTDYHYNIARIGEAYMNLAEAALLKGNVEEAVEALNMTRTVHGGLPASTAQNKAEAWADYIRERRCEMCNECGDLYWSYLRWGKYGGEANYGRPAGDVIRDLDAPVYKIEINRDRTAILIGQMTLLNCAQRSFSTKRYLLPIEQSFLNTREAYGMDCEQNPGW